MSRLARSCKDWHQLLELCALFRTILADEDGLYDPTDHNDRLLLGLTGIMSEAELHLVCSIPASLPYWCQCREELCHPPEALTSWERLFPPAWAQGIGTSCGFDR